MMQSFTTTETVLVRKPLTRSEGLEVVHHFLRSLEIQSLEVVLVPSRDPDCADKGGKIRAVESHNPDWYRDFCSEYTAQRGRLISRDEWCGGWHRTNGKCLSRRHRPKRGRMFKHDTAIKRRDTIRGLNELLAGRCESMYAHRLRDFIRREGWKYQGGVVSHGQMWDVTRRTNHFNNATLSNSILTT